MAIHEAMNGSTAWWRHAGGRIFEFLSDSAEPMNRIELLTYGLRRGTHQPAPTRIPSALSRLGGKGSGESTRALADSRDLDPLAASHFPDAI
jgi:hypothetical protein